MASAALRSYASFKIAFNGSEKELDCFSSGVLVRLGVHMRDEGLILEISSPEAAVLNIPRES
jgi:hypothetical protein